MVVIHFRKVNYILYLHIYVFLKENKFSLFYEKLGLTQNILFFFILSTFTLKSSFFKI